MRIETFVRKALVEAAQATEVTLHEVDSIRLAVVYAGGRLQFVAEVQALGRLDVLSSEPIHNGEALRTACAGLRAINERGIETQPSFKVIDERGKVEGTVAVDGRRSPKRNDSNSR